MNIIKLIDLSYDPNRAQRIPVESKEKLKLLSPQSHWVDRSQNWNPRIVEALHVIDKEAALTLRDRESCIDKLKVTMIKPVAQLATSDLRYDAMTYTWHRDSWNLAEGLTASSTASGHSNDATGNVPCPISTEMWKIVLSESATAGNLLWVDQICINQKDRDEKMVAVGFTDRVYQNADRVFIVIEDISISQDASNSVREIIAMGHSDVQSLDPEVVQHAFSFSVTLFSARVFSRSWCLHEFACSDRHIFFIPIAADALNSGFQVLRLESQQLLGVLRLAALLIRNATEEQMLEIIPFATSIQRALQSGTKLFKGLKNPTFPEAFRNSFRSLAKLKSDQVTITLNSCNTGLLFTGPEPKSEDECYRILNSVALAAGDASVIGVTGRTLSNRDGSLSTWLMEPSNDESRPGFAFMNQKPTSFDVSVDEGGALTINVIKLALVREVQQPNSNVLDIASAFMDQNFEGIYDREPFVLERKLHDAVTNDWQRGELRLRHVNQKFFYAQALALLLEKSDDGFLNSLEDDRIIGTKILYPIERERLIAVLEWLRSYSGPTGGHSFFQARPHEITNDDFAIVAKFMTAFVNRILGVKDMYDTGKLESWMSYTIGTLNSTKLSMNGLPIVVPRTFQDAMITIPADVASADYSLLRRAWILQSEDELPTSNSSGNNNSSRMQKCFLVAKSMLVGFQDVQTDDVQKIVIH